MPSAKSVGRGCHLQNCHLQNPSAKSGLQNCHLQNRPCRLRCWAFIIFGDNGNKYPDEIMAKL